MNKLIERPVVFFDTETTGTDIAKDRIAEIALIKVEWIGDQREQLITRFQAFINPGIPMSPGAVEITGLTDEYLKDFPPFRTVAPGIYEFMKGCDIAGHNIVQFDIPLLVEEFLRVNINFPEPDIKFIDTLRIQAELFPRNLAFVYEFLTGEKPDASKLHGAMADAELSMKIADAQMKDYSDRLPDSDEGIHQLSIQGKKIVDFAGKLTVNDTGDIVYTFGKNEGKKVSSDPNYASWILSNDFTLDTKRWVQHALKNNGKLQGQSLISF